MAGVVQHLSDGQLCQNKKKKSLPALGAEDIASLSLLVLFPVRSVGLGSCLCLPLGPTDLLTGANSGGGCTGLGTRCDDLRATQRGDGRRERETLEEVETLDAGAVGEVTWLETGPAGEAGPTWEEGEPPREAGATWEKGEPPQEAGPTREAGLTLEGVDEREGGTEWEGT
jgi:hypothetical protein